MTAATAFTIFDTAAGPCAVAWHDTALTGVELPSDTLDATRAACVRRWTAAVECVADVARLTRCQRTQKRPGRTS